MTADGFRVGATPGARAFSWSLASGCPSRDAPAVTAAESRDCPSFRQLLTSASADLFDALLSEGGPFTVQLRLSDGRLFRMTAAFEGEGTDRRLSGTLDELCHGPSGDAAPKARAPSVHGIAEHSPAMLWMGDHFGKCVFLNQAQRDFWGVDPEDLSTFDWGATLHPEDIDKLAGPFGQAMKDQTAFTVEARYRRADGQFRTLRTQARPRFDDAGRFLGMTGVNTDITDQLVAEERNRLLMGELNHRTKNLLAVVQAVARQTARNAEGGEFRRAFDERLRAMAASNDLLLKNDWYGATIAELVDVQLRHLSDFIGHRIFIAGPELRLTSAAAQTVGMALHELATNSLKHGILQGGEGRIDLRWSREAGVPGYSLSWIESGGRPAPVAEGSARRGFGHTVIVDMIASTLDASVDVSVTPDGFRWLVTARSDLGLSG